VKRHICQKKVKTENGKNKGKRKIKVVEKVAHFENQP